MSTEAVSIARSRARPTGVEIVRQLWRQWRRQSQVCRQMARFSDRELRDLGVTPSDIERQLARPFWRYPFP
jgi:uncharacterized protein YjiS (DUF1127 family)